ncbi:MAG: SGNH hydrolase domain-containing protein, partial [Pseudomonadota bacterium]|nr:SGNH hydrolase domain-containing protein [Pseudomonadota bacterium]
SPRCDVNIKDTTAPHVTEYKAVLENGFKRTLSALHNQHKQVLIVLDNPFLKALPNHCLENRLPLYSQRQPCIETEQEHRANDLVKTYNAVATDLAKRYENVKVVDLANVLCEQGVCKAVINDTLLYKDQSHLSVFGSRYVAPYILQAMN